jgi:hypothetical protein
VARDTRGKDTTVEIVSVRHSWSARAHVGVGKRTAVRIETRSGICARDAHTRIMSTRRVDVGAGGRVVVGRRGKVAASTGARLL